MLENIQSIGASICEWTPAPYFFFSGNVFANLIYYSHLFPALIALLLAVFVLLNNPKGQLNRMLFLLTLVFTLWSLSDLILWAMDRADYIMFFWSILIHFDVLIYVISYYFVYFFLFKSFAPLKHTLGMFALLLPILFLAPSSFNLIGFDFSNCEREAIEGVLWHYAYLVEILIVIATAFISIKAFRDSDDKARRKSITLMVVGIVFFLLSFSLGNLIGSFSFDWTISQYGLFGMPIFMGFLAYLIVNYNLFNVRVLSTQIFVVTLWLLTVALLFLRTVDVIRVVVFINIVLFSVLGYFLVRSVKEVERQRVALEKANAQQQSLMRFINHQVKGFLTRTRTIFDSLKNGDFGKLEPEVGNLVNVGFDTSTQAVQMVKSILDAANLHDGAVKYTMIDFDLRALVSDITTQLKSVVDDKGLEFEINVDPRQEMIIHGDLTQFAQAVRNLIENSIQYTEKGKVTVNLAKQNDFAVFSVSDTGLGLTEKDKSVLFSQGGRGEEAAHRNVNSTGYGLYITHKIVTDHGGQISATSPGRDQGSTFTITIPLAK
ncbi:HAMP domain-containing histidine kinase [Candidatus Nomurabacteria bacterium]|nr:HAMP domain-containing histidine kinase [Candidatus Nomurabacteria bacterium]